MAVVVVVVVIDMMPRRGRGRGGGGGRRLGQGKVRAIPPHLSFVLPRLPAVVAARGGARHFKDGRGKRNQTAASGGDYGAFHPTGERLHPVCSSYARRTRGGNRNIGRACDGITTMTTMMMTMMMTTETMTGGSPQRMNLVGATFGALLITPP